MATNKSLHSRVGCFKEAVENTYEAIVDASGEGHEEKKPVDKFFEEAAQGESVKSMGENVRCSMLKGADESGQTLYAIVPYTGALRRRANCKI